METFATLFERFLVFVSHCFDRIVIQWALSNHPAGSGQAHSTRRLRGKLYSVLEKLDRGHHVMRVYCKNLVGRMYEKFSAFLRVEVCVNRMKDLALNKGLENLEALRKRLAGITDRFAGFEAQSLNVHVDFPLFQKIALPVLSGKTKIAGNSAMTCAR